MVNSNRGITTKWQTMNSDRWRVIVPADLSIVVYAKNRAEAEQYVKNILFHELVSGHAHVEQMSITDFYDDEFFIDPEPLCKCGRLPECCDCDEDDE